MRILLITLFACLGMQAQTTKLLGNVYHDKPLINVNDTTAVKIQLRRNSDGRDVTASWAYIASVIGSVTATPTLNQVAIAGNETTLPLYANSFVTGESAYKEGQINAGSGSIILLPELAGSFYPTIAIRRDGTIYYADLEGITDIGTTSITIDDNPTSGSPNAVSSGGVFDALALKANLNSPTFTGTPNVPTAAPGTNNIQAASTAFVGAAITSATTPDATTTVKGKVKLAGDLVGTADLPTVIAASETVAGKLRLATSAESTAGTVDNAAITPLKQKNYTDARLGALTTDAVPSTTTNKYVIVGTTQPSTSNTVKLVTTNTVTPNTDGTGSQSKGAFVQLDGLPASITQNQRVFSTAKWTGDGNMLGASLTTGQSYREKVNNQLGFSMLDNTTSGTRIIDKYKGLLDTDIAEIRFIGLGVNDMRQYGTSSAPSFGNFMLGLLLSSYTQTSVKGQQMTLSGTDWTPDTLQADTTTGVSTTVTGATATFKRIGSAIYLTIALVPGGNATYTITVDGVSQTVLANNDSGAISGTGYPAASGATSVAYYPYTHRFSGFTAGAEHTVIITKTGGTSPLRVIWGLSNGQLPSNMTYNGVSQYVIPVSKLTPGVAGISGYAFYGGSDAAVDAYNAAEKTIIYQLNDDGINVRLLDINQVFNPNTTGYTQANGFNFTALANTNIANLLISNLTAYPVRSQQKLDRLDEYLATKLSMADLSNYVDLTSNQSISGNKSFSMLRSANITNSSGSPTQGTLAQSTTTQGWGFVRNLTSGFAGYAQQVNSANTGDIFGFLNSTGQVSGVRSGGNVWGPNGTASNDYITFQQMNNRAVTMVSAAYTIIVSDYYVELTTGTFTVTLPTAVGMTGKEYVIKNGGSGVMTLAAQSGQTIDGSATKIYNTQYGGTRVISNGSNWRINGSF